MIKNCYANLKERLYVLLNVYKMIPRSLSKQIFSDEKTIDVIKNWKTPIHAS